MADVEYFDIAKAHALDINGIVLWYLQDRRGRIWRGFLTGNTDRFYVSPRLVLKLLEEVLARISRILVNVEYGPYSTNNFGFQAFYLP